jgi:hypothetical protein
VYIDIFTGAVKSKGDTEATIEAEVAEVGIYTGSATGVGGSIQRWLHYDRITFSFIPKNEYSKKGHHHWFSTIPGCTMDLRAVALSFCPLNTSFWPISTKGVVVALLGTLGDSGDRKPIATSSMFEWYQKCLEAMTDLRITLKAEPLNHSWPLLQVLYRCIPTPETCLHCGLNPMRRVDWLRQESKHVCMGCYERQTQRQTVKTSGQTRCRNPDCDWSFGPYNVVKNQRPGMAPREGISDKLVLPNRSESCSHLWSTMDSSTA